MLWLFQGRHVAKVVSTPAMASIEWLNSEIGKSYHRQWNWEIGEPAKKVLKLRATNLAFLANVADVQKN